MTGMTVAQVDSIIESAPQNPITLPAYTGSTSDLSYLKSYVLAQVTARYGVSASTFDSATLLSTTILRDFVHRAIYDHPTLQTYDQLFAEGDASNYLSDVGSFFRQPNFLACGEISWLLHEIYEAFGYQSTTFGVINGDYGTGTPTSYNDGHVRVEVYLPATGQWIDQDPTFNLLMTDASGTPLSYSQAQYLEFTNPSALHLDETGIYTYVSYGEAYGPPGDWNSTYYLSDYMKGVYSSTAGGIYSQQFIGTSEDDPITEHTQVFYGAFASAQSAEAAVGAALAEVGGDLLKATDILRPNHQVSGFRLLSVDGSTDLGDYITVQLTSGAYVSINIKTGAIIDGSYDQIVNQLTAKPNLSDPGGNPQAFFGPAVFIKFDGTVDLSQDLTTSNPNVAPIISEEIARTAVVPLVAGTTIMEDWNGTGAPQQVTFQQGDYLVTTFGNPQTSTWTQEQTYYHANGQMFHQTVNYADGEFAEVDYDLSNSQTWSYEQQRFSPTGRLEAQLFDYHAGGSLLIQFDVNNTQVWSDEQSRYNSTGQLSAQSFDYHAGGGLVVQYDVNDTHVWSTEQSLYNSTAQLTAQRFDYHAGGWLLTQYDVNDTQVWSDEQSQYNASGQLVAQRFDYHAGGWLAVAYDPGDTSTWADIQDLYSPSGAHIAERIDYLDGHYTITTY